MSETDDTDILLLIPPNFFHVHSSDSDSSSFHDSTRTVVKRSSLKSEVITGLMTQVHSLETRIESLENSTISEVTSELQSLTTPRNRNYCFSSPQSASLSSFNKKSYTFPRRKRRKISEKKSANKTHNSSLSSASDRFLNVTHSNYPNLTEENLQSISQQFDTLSMDDDLSSIVSTPSKKTDKLLLNEIDDFLSKVDSFEVPEEKLSSDKKGIESIIKATGEYISQTIDNQASCSMTLIQRNQEDPNDFLKRYIYLTNQDDKANSSTNNFKEKDKSDVCSTNANETSSIQEPKIRSARKLNFAQSRDIQTTSTPKKCQPEFQPAMNKVYNKATKILEQYKLKNQPNVEQSISSFSNYSSPQRLNVRSYKSKFSNIEHQDLKQPMDKYIESVDTDLLSLSDLWGENAARNGNGKLEEERFKREHCEAMIQELQKKILEQQEKLAVAVKVDRAKDQAILKLKDAWSKITKSLQNAESRHAISLQKMTNEMTNLKSMADEAQTKTKHFEAELYKTLDLAHDYQEKCKQMSLDKQNLEEDVNKKLKEMENTVVKKDEEITSLKENNEIVIRLNKQSGELVKNLECSLQHEQQNHESTKLVVDEMKLSIQKLSDNISLIEQERDILKEKIKEERSKYSCLEVQMSDYQNQLCEAIKKEDLLQTELKNIRKHNELQKNELKNYYQRQLEDAVLSKLREFQQQLESAEKEIEREAKSKEAYLTDAYNKQISRIQEQHRLEISLMNEKHREEMKLCRLQITQANERISSLESKLEGYRRRRGEIASQLHGVMETQWREALRILTRGAPTHPHDGQQSSRDLSTDLKMAQSLPTFNDELSSINLSRKSDDRPNHAMPTKQADRHPDGFSDNEIQNYVKMLLSKPPDFLSGSGDCLPDAAHKYIDEEPTSDRQEHRRPKKGSGTSKPPWKA